MAASASTRVKTTTVMSKFMKVPKVSYTTFFKWNTIINTQVVDGAVVKVWCTKHADKIIRDARGTSKFYSSFVIVVIVLLHKI